MAITKMKTENIPSRMVLLVPLIGMSLFTLFYFIAAVRYPGGSWIVPDQAGFSFWHNYLCDLLDLNAINGELNVGRHFARAALAVLCSGLIVLWYYLPRMFSTITLNHSIMRISGVLSLLITLLLSSGTHDVTVRIAGFFGVVAFVSCFIELFKARHFKLLISGVSCLFIFLVNYFIYETGTFIKALPAIQKITFVCFILWFISLDIFFYKKLKSSRSERKTITNSRS